METAMDTAAHPDPERVVLIQDLERLKLIPVWRQFNTMARCSIVFCSAIHLLILCDESRNQMLRILGCSEVMYRRPVSMSLIHTEINMSRVMRTKK